MLALGSHIVGDIDNLPHHYPTNSLLQGSHTNHSHPFLIDSDWVKDGHMILAKPIHILFTSFAQIIKQPIMF